MLRDIAQFLLITLMFCALVVMMIFFWKFILIGALVCAIFAILIDLCQWAWGNDDDDEDNDNNIESI